MIDWILAIILLVVPNDYPDALTCFEGDLIDVETGGLVFYDENSPLCEDTADAEPA